MYYYIFGGAGVLLIIWAIGSYLAIRYIEEPTYTLLERKQGYEIREYQPYIVAETTVTGGYRESLNQGFRLIADYIFGNNTTKQSISMTTPVLEAVAAVQSEKIAMTVPVIETATSNETRTVSFVLPATYTMETLPIPNNDAVRLLEVPAQTVAVLRFSWYATPERVAAKKETLRTLLERDGVVTIGSYRSALYNPPLSMPLTLRNEIIVPIQ